MTEPSRHPRLRLVAALLLGAYVLFFLGYLCLHTDKAQWDFKTYYWAAQAFSEGANPYDLQTLSKLANEKITLPYLYTPITLYLFLPFSWLSFSGAFYLYLAIKVLCVLALFTLWLKSFLMEMDPLLFLFISLIAFNNSLVLDVLAGNITVFEQLLLWSGFLFLLRGKLLPFAALLIAVSCFKITTFFFVTLLLFSRARSKWIVLAGASVVFAGILWGNSSFAPELTNSLRENLKTLSQDHDLRGNWNPSTFALLRDLLVEVFVIPGIPIHRYHPILLWLLSSLCVIGVSYRTLVRSKLRPEAMEHLAVLLGCCVYLLVNPRLVVYSYTVLLVPACYLLIHLKGRNAFLFAVALLLIPSTQNVHLVGFQVLTKYLWDYHTLLAAYAIWGGYLWGIHQGVFQEDLTNLGRQEGGVRRVGERSSLASG